MKLILMCCVLLVFSETHISEGKRGGGSRGSSSRGKSSGSSWWWGGGNNKKSSSSSSSSSSSHGSKQPVEPPKPSAPKLETKTNAYNQQSAVHTNQQTNQKPIGWNVPGNNQQSAYNKQGTYQQSHAYNTNNQPHGAWPNTGHQNYPQQHGTWGSQQSGAWGNQHGSSWGNQHSGGWGNQQGGWGGGYGQNAHSGFGGGYNGYRPSYGGGYNSWGGGGGGGYGGGMGGFGRMGGYGGMGGYGMKPKSSFFGGGSTFGNILTGMAIYHVSSSLMKAIFGGGQHSRPYNVYNYYNQPPGAQQEIKLPSNMLSICEGNLTNACPGAAAICTTNNTVLCVVTMSQTTPCEQGNAMCVNTTIPCVDKSDPLCQNTTQQQTEATVNVPCYTNLTVDVNLLNEPGGGTNGAEYQYCVTTMAVAGPDYKSCSDESVLQQFDYRSILAGNYTFNLTVSPMMRKYQVYNYDNPTQTPSGEVVLPLESLIPCIDNATKICHPDTITLCTGFGEIMCIQPIASTSYCDDYNTTCQKIEVQCKDIIDDDFLCQNKTDEDFTIKEENKFVHINIPCFANITINTNLPNFDIQTFNGTVPQAPPSSFMYHYQFCLGTMSLPGPETDICIIKEKAV